MAIFSFLLFAASVTLVPYRVWSCYLTPALSSSYVSFIRLPFVNLENVVSIVGLTAAWSPARLKVARDIRFCEFEYAMEYL